MARTKTVFRKSQEVAHVWASKSQSEGRCCNVYFDGATIYSYGRHFPMARHLPDGSVALTTRSYSSTTSGHLWDVRHAISHLKVIHVDDVVSSPAYLQASVKKDIQHLLELSASARMTVTKNKHRRTAVYMAEQFNLYAKAHKSRLRVNPEKLKNLDLSKLKEDLAKQAVIAKARAEALDKKRAVERAAALAEQIEKEKVSRPLWRSHEFRGYFHDPVMLRLSEGGVGGVCVETSAGAIIPLDAALRLWPVILRVMKGDKDYEVGMALGHYRLTQIRTDGSIKVGCHDIAFDEIEGIAKQLGLLERAA